MPLCVVLRCVVVRLPAPSPHLSCCLFFAAFHSIPFRAGRGRCASGKITGPPAFVEAVQKRNTECVKLHGEHLVQVLLKGIAGRAPHQTFTWLANVLWFLIVEYVCPSPLFVAVVLRFLVVVVVVVVPWSSSECA